MWVSTCKYICKWVGDLVRGGRYLDKQTMPEILLDGLERWETQLSVSVLTCSFQRLIWLVDLLSSLATWKNITCHEAGLVASQAIKMNEGRESLMLRSIRNWRGGGNTLASKAVWKVPVTLVFLSLQLMGTSDSNRIAILVRRYGVVSRNSMLFYNDTSTMCFP